MVDQKSIPRGDLTDKTLVLVGGRKRRFGNTAGIYGESMLHAQDSTVFRPYRVTKLQPRKNTATAFEKFVKSAVFAMETMDNPVGIFVDFYKDSELQDMQEVTNSDMLPSILYAGRDQYLRESTPNVISIDLYDLSKDVYDAYKRLRIVSDATFSFQYKSGKLIGKFR